MSDALDETEVAPEQADSLHGEADLPEGPFEPAVEIIHDDDAPAGRRAAPTDLPHTSAVRGGDAGDFE